MKYGMGALPDTPDKRDYQYGDVMKAIRVPDVVDYEKEMTLIKNQGAKGACVAFAICAIREWKERKDRKGSTGLWEDMAEDYIYAQVQVHPGGGSYPRQALKTLRSHGVCPEKFYPYKRGSDKEAMEWKPSLRARNSARRFKIDNYVRLRNLNDILQSLTVNGPVFIGGYWLSGWDDRRRKKIDGYPVFSADQGRPDGGHAYVIVGFDVSRGLLKCRNSWGRSFGKNGYFYLTFDALKHAMDIWAIIDKDHPLRR